MATALKSGAQNRRMAHQRNVELRHTLHAAQERLYCPPMRVRTILLQLHCDAAAATLINQLPQPSACEPGSTYAVWWQSSEEGLTRLGMQLSKHVNEADFSAFWLVFSLAHTVPKWTNNPGWQCGHAPPRADNSYKFQ